MGFEEEFDITVEEENSENITTVQEAADMIDKLVDNKAPGAQDVRKKKKKKKSSETRKFI